MKNTGKASTVEIWTVSTSPDGKSALPALGRSKTEISHIDVSTLTVNLSDFLTSVQTLFEAAPSPKSLYVVDEIELSLGVNASGGIAIIGKLEAGAEAAIKVTLKRRENKG